MVNGKWLSSANAEPGRLAPPAAIAAPRDAFAQRNADGRRLAANLSYALFFIAMLGVIVLAFPKN